MSDATTKPRIALLGVPIEIGASQAGTLMGPAALRTAGIAPHPRSNSDSPSRITATWRCLKLVADEGPPPAERKIL